MSDEARRAKLHAVPIHMTASDMRRLMALVKEYRREGREDANLDVLDQELHRALVMDAERRLASDVVTLDSRVVVVDLDSGEETEFTVVVPADADADKGRISVLDPLGMAILGYRSRQEIEWEVAGRPRRWMVRRVIHQPEAEAKRAGR